MTQEPRGERFADTGRAQAGSGSPSNAAPEPAFSLVPSLFAMSFPRWGDGSVSWEDAAFEMDGDRLVGVYRREDAE